VSGFLVRPSLRYPLRPLVRLLAALLVVAAPLVTPAEGPDDDFDVREQPPSVALGPAPRGGVIVSAGLGWLRSDLTIQLGLGSWLDLVLRGDAMVLYDGFNAQNTFYGGFRVSPFNEGIARLTLALEAGEIFVPVHSGAKTVPVVRGEISAGMVLRGLSGKSAYDDDHWSSDTEAGLGVEGHVRRRLVLGAEVFAWSRPDADTLWQWRLRVGWSI
jgi:hypothetical protein